MQPDLKSMITFGQHLRSHLNVPLIDFEELGIQLKTVKVFPFHEEHVWTVNMTVEQVFGNTVYDADLVRTFVMKVEMIETPAGLRDTFTIYEDQEAVETLETREVRPYTPAVAPEVAELPTESKLILPGQD
ncbi:hypothetical protein NVP1244A_168 [Vibrio phage 1.244.A._10N.261.54.C3]|nr:hypothetical protein NVP1244A_168 [Vibrio phage 1.244.A._10N.261.54.C3]AUR98796.1 hypothetical protein NVP1255O_168 [Vibrio phage 1.255.O._10N.286.45.F1]